MTAGGGVGVCETCNGRGEIGGWVGQTPENAGWDSVPCPDCDRQDVLAVLETVLADMARDGLALDMHYEDIDKARAAIAELIAADKAFDLSRAALVEVSNRITAGSRSDDDFRKQANAQHSYDRATARRASALAALENQP